MLVLVLLPGPVAAQEADDDAYTRLYGHVYGMSRTDAGYVSSYPNPMNTIEPIGENDFSRGTLVLAVSADGLPECQGRPEIPLVGSTPILETWAGNCDPVYDVKSNEVWYFQYNDKTPWSNDVEYEEAGGFEAYTEGRALLKDIKFDPTRSLLAQQYMSADTTVWYGMDRLCTPAVQLCYGDFIPIDYKEDIPWPWPSWNDDYGVFPNWVVESHAYAVSPQVMTDYNTTDVPLAIANDRLGPEEGVVEIGWGKTVPFTMMSVPTTVGGTVIYPFNVDLGPALVESIASGDTVWWWNDWYAENMDGVKNLYGQGYAVNSGEFFQPVLSLPITNPMDIEMVMPQFTDDNKLVVIALFNSPFGAYDVPLDSASFEIVDPDGRVIATQDDTTVTWMQKAAREQQSLLGVSPEAAIARGQATWLWNYLAEEDIQPGDYTIRVTAENMQGKAASKEAFFTIDSGLGAGGVTSSLGGMFTFSKEDIKKLEECHGCHDAATGELLSGVQDLTMAEAKAMQADGTLGTDASEGPAEKDTPAAGVVSLTMLLGALAIALRRKTE